MPKAIIQIFEKSENKGRKRPVFDNYRPTLKYHLETKHFMIELSIETQINPGDFGYCDVNFLFTNNFKNKSFSLHEGNKIIGWGEFIN